MRSERIQGGCLLSSELAGATVSDPECVHQPRSSLGLVLFEWCFLEHVSLSIELLAKSTSGLFVHVKLKF